MRKTEGSKLDKKMWALPNESDILNGGQGVATTKRGCFCVSIDQFHDFQLIESGQGSTTAAVMQSLLN